ncbi:MAG: hypothetical protein D6702_02795 [Planctomycetota bacterium]|nr:MAG: hypothetical protein D6702_02795 [Planctomycetota bacterium]
MKRSLAAAFLAAAAAFLLLGWAADRRRADTGAPPAVEVLRRIPASAWAAPVFGPEPPQRPAEDLSAGLRSWGLEAETGLEGGDLLAAGRAGAAAGVLLRSWLKVTPGSGGRALRLALERPNETGPILLRAELAGPPMAVLGWVRALLAWPVGEGIVADPRRLVVRAEGRELRAELGVAAWPAGWLLTAAAEDSE